MADTQTQPVSGPDLRKLRRDAEVEAAELSRFMGCSRKHVHDIEKWATVPDDKAAKFREGVESLRRAPAGSE